MTEHTVNECCARTIAVRASSRRKVEPTNFMVQRVGADLERTKFARSPTNLVPQRVSADLAPADFMPQRVAADLERMKFMPHRVGADLQRIHLVRQRVGADLEPTHFMGRRTHLTGQTALQATDCGDGADGRWIGLSALSGAGRVYLGLRPRLGWRRAVGAGAGRHVR